MVKKLNKAIILAAGKGSRLKKVLKGNPKPLLGIGKSTLLEILIKKLKDLKIKKILVVTGYKSNQIKNKIGKSAKCIYYPNFNKTNNLHTLLHIKKELNEPLLCLFSDVIFDIKILKKLIDNKKDIVVAVDKKSRLSGTMRVKIKKSVISEIGSQIKVKNSSGNFIGFAKFSTFGCKMIKKILNEYKKTNFKDYYTEVLNNLIEKKKVVNFVNVGQFYWKEIDTNKDYIKAKKIYKKNL